MPYYKWSGLTVQGKTKNGYLFAQSIQQLDEELFKLHIALLVAKDSSWLMFQWSIRSQDKADVFMLLNELLEYGLHITDACVMIGRQSENPKIQQVFLGVSQKLFDGLSVYEALRAYSFFFDSFACQAFFIGQETNNMHIVCKLLASYYQVQANFHKKIYNALMMPITTALFLLIVAFMFLFFFVPHIAHIFKSMRITLPSSTQYMIQLSAWLHDWLHLLMVLSIAVLIGILVYFVRKSKQYKVVKEFLLVRLPFLRLIKHAYDQAQFFSFLGVLLQSGIKVDQAVYMIANMVDKDTKLQVSLQKISLQLQSGRSLSFALAQHLELFTLHQIMVIRIAQETNTVGHACQKIGTSTFLYLDQLLNRIVFWIGPALLLLLGLCIALLVFGIYSPLMQLSFTVGQ